MASLTALSERLRAEFDGLRVLDVGALLFGHRADATTIALILLGLAVAFLLVRLARGPRVGRNLITLPSMLLAPRSRRHALRHLPLLLATAALPCFALALADPLTAVVQQRTTYPGRRIAVLLDASSSMMVPFTATRLRERTGNDAVFLTTVAAAETFVRQRKNGKYHDLISLVEFGDEAYVIMPFTSDYDNVLLSISLIGDWGEYMRFPDGGTAIGRAIDQGTALFKNFEYLDAAGNVMVIFSDGEDTQVATRGKSLDDVLAAAVKAKIPVYLIRTSRGKGLGEVIPDNIWKPAVEKTGGRFYAASIEDDVIRAIRDIDQQSAGTIELTWSSTRQPRFAPFALAAVALWTLALGLKLTVPAFTKFP